MKKVLKTTLYFSLITMLFSCKDELSVSVLEGCCDNPPLNTMFGLTRVYVANVFTPNGDAHNDHMVISTNSFARIVSLDIKDAAGNTVFTTTTSILQKDIFAWNGEVNNEVVKGYYTYTLTLADFEGTTETFEGGICNYPCDFQGNEEKISSAGCTFPAQTMNGVFDSTIASGEINGCFEE